MTPRHDTSLPSAGLWRGRRALPVRRQARKAFFGFCMTVGAGWVLHGDGTFHAQVMEETPSRPCSPVRHTETVMMKRYWLNRVEIEPGPRRRDTLIVAGLPSPASAQIVQVSSGDARNSVGFNLGYFAVRGEDVRIDDDVLLANLDDLAFEIGDFSGFSFGGEWLYGIGDFIEAGVGVNYYQKTVPSLYRDFVDVDGTEILQDLKLRVLPITPLCASFHRPRRTGSAIRRRGNWVFHLALHRIRRVRRLLRWHHFPRSLLGGRHRRRSGGARWRPFPIGDAMTTGVEFRWQKAEGDTDQPRAV